MMFTDDEQHFLNTNNVRFAELLTGIIPNINICTKFGTKLHDACNDDDYEMAKMLVDKGINIYIKNSEGKVAIFDTNDHKIIDLLFDSINETDNNNNTKLHYLIKSYDFDIARYIIQKGARLDIKNLEGKTVKDLIMSTLTDTKSTTDTLYSGEYLSGMTELANIVSNIKPLSVTVDDVVNMYNKLSEEDKIKVLNKIIIVKGGPGVTGIISKFNYNEEWVKVNVNDIVNDTSVIAKDINDFVKDTSDFVKDTSDLVKDTSDLAKDSNIKIDTDSILKHIENMDISEQKNIASKIIDIIMSHNS